MAWLYVPDMEALKSELNDSLMNTEPFVMWRGKPLPPHTLLKKWKKGGWITLLSGLTCEPSRAKNGLEKWILSLEDSHANPIQVLESNSLKRIHGIYGPTSKELLGKCDQTSSSLRMFQVSLNGDLIKLSLTSTNWGIMRHGVLWALPKLGHFTKEEDGSYLRTLPTPTTQGNVQVLGQYNKKNGTTLGGYARMFPTPTASDGTRTNLTYGAGNLTLKGHVKMLPTPTSNEDSYRLKGNSQASKCLAALAKKGELTNGKDPFNQSGRLNPQWVAWLMGLPIGWINLDYSGTE